MSEDNNDTNNDNKRRYTAWDFVEDWGLFLAIGPWFILGWVNLAKYIVDTFN